MKTIIAPSILAANWACFRDEVKAVEEAGADWIHLDVMDGHFVPPITFGPGVLKSIKNETSLKLDVHLMIEKPELQIQSFVDAGADIITVHQEASPHLHRTLQSIREKGLKAGVAINPSTPVSVLEPVRDLVDLVCIMTVNPGWGGQKFIESSPSKIQQARNMFPEPSVHVQVDGGVTADTARTCLDSGADVLVAGTAVFGSKDYKQAIKLIRTAS